jgi:glycosyltransferase involved in cell wall biosynthesis
VNSRTIYFAGPLPPPVHGLSVISAHVLNALKSDGAVVHVFDLTPRKMFLPLLQWVSYLWTLMIRGSVRSILYVPLSGGLRQIIDLAFVVPALLLGFQIFIHHHSFAYLNAKPWFARLVFHFIKKSIHVALCQKMGELLTSQYGVDPKQIRVLSNAAFIDIARSAPMQVKERTAELTIGFLSNITAEKGIFRFFETVKALHDNNLPCRAMIAGPVSADIRAQFEETLNASPNTHHLGAIYGDAKESFFQSIDVLLFPTQYANEAEPVTLWEAMAQGIPVIALQRGCIQGMVPIGAGRVVFDAADFVSTVVDEIRSLKMSPAGLTVRRVAAREAFDQALQENSLVLKSLLNEMTRTGH